MKNLTERSLARAILRRPGVASRLRDEGVAPERVSRAAVEAVAAESPQPIAARPPMVGLGLSGPTLRTVESIILEVGRPTLLVTNGDFELPEDEELAGRLTRARSLVRPAIAAVGRIEVDDGFRRFPAGTGWLIADSVIITNRHVAEFFVSSSENGGPPEFMRDFQNRPFEVFIDFLEEHGLPGEREIRLEKVLYVAERRTSVADVAIFEITRSSGLPRPIPLSPEAPGNGSWVGVIGYPLPDDRVPPDMRDAEERYFENIYGVKRLAPGAIKPPTGGGATPWLVAHDATTLGGNSGSAVIDLGTGAAVALHFAGRPKIENLAVSSVHLAELLAKTKAKPTIITVGGGDFHNPDIAEIEEEAPSAAIIAELQARPGYKANFIGAGAAFKIPLPKITGDAPGEIAELNGGGDELKYLHFSVKMNAARRLCYFSAVNIHGKQTFSIKGTRPGWKFDPRFNNPVSVQIKNECYGLEQDGKFSRGHMTRREDPNWGPDRDTAVVANGDTFYVTNACPQMQPFNAGIWLSLEDYALENADQDDMKISVFTGPIFDDDNDPEFHGVQVPVRFWKIIAFKHDQTGELTATGYTMNQESALPSEDEFVFGQFKSSQVPITRIERLTGLDFNQLRKCDPLATDEETVVERVLRSPGDLVFGRQT